MTRIGDDEADGSGGKPSVEGVPVVSGEQDALHERRCVKDHDPARSAKEGTTAFQLCAEPLEAPVPCLPVPGEHGIELVFAIAPAVPASSDRWMRPWPDAAANCAPPVDVPGTPGGECLT